MFVRSWILVGIGILSYTPFIGFIFGWSYLPFDIFSDYIPLFATLYLTNAAYDAFHPTVAPELSFTAPAVGEACFDWDTFAVFNTQASGGQCTSANYQASLDHKYYQQIFGENVGTQGCNSYEYTEADGTKSQRSLNWTCNEANIISVEDFANPTCSGRGIPNSMIVFQFTDGEAQCLPNYDGYSISFKQNGFV